MKLKKRDTGSVPEGTRRRFRILYGDGRALEPEDEPVESIARRLSGLPPDDPVPSAWTASAFIQNFLRRFSSELKLMAESKVIEAEVTECEPGNPVMLDLSPGAGVLAAGEPRPAGIRAGSRIWIALVDTPESQGGQSHPAVCSRRRAQGCRALSVIESMWAGGLWIEGIPVEYAAGEGWIVDIDGFKAALPEAESGESPSDRIRLNVATRFSIVHYDAAAFCVILSRKKFLAAERQVYGSLARHRIQPGQILDGRVASIGTTCAWIDVGGMMAELSGADAGFGPARENLAALQTGQALRVFVLDVQPDKTTVGSRQLLPDPWVFAKKSFQPGTKIDVRVRAIGPEHVKVELKDGFIGEIPWKEAGWQIGDPGELEHYFQVGSTIEAVIQTVLREASTILLSTKALHPDPLPELQRLYPVGAHCSVSVVACQDTKARVVTQDGYFGFILPDDLSWSAPVSPKAFFGPASGKRVQVEVLSIDPAARLIRFGVKQVKPDPFLILVRDIETGKTYDGRVVKIIAVGALVEIRKGLVGLLRKSDYAEGDPPPAEGQTVQIMVMSIQKDQRRIALSRRAVVELEERRDMQPFLAAPQEERKVRMKDILQGDAFKRFFEKS